METRFNTQEFLTYIRTLVDKINESNSSNEKIKTLRSIWKDAKNEQNRIDRCLHLHYIQWALRQTYSPYIKFGVTSEQIKKRMMSLAGPNLFMDDNLDIKNLFEKLANRELTGHQALQTICDVLYYLPENLREIVYNIIDKNLKIRMDAKSINKVIPDLIPTFEVSLCNVYADRKHKVNWKDMWLSSRKLDGVRCVTIIDYEGTIRFFSRQGKEFNTLEVIRKQLQRLNLRNTVIDGEMCIVNGNGNEDFKSITKEITRKDHAIINPMYKTFDIMTLDEFNKKHTDRAFFDRYCELTTLVTNYYVSLPENENPHIQLVEMTEVKDQEHFEELFAEAQKKNWEGLVIRKNDTTICKRSDSMLKCKAFRDAEYVVEDVEFGPFRVIKDGKEVEEEVMTNAFITHKGNRVSVGSGWSLEQRRQYKEHPENLIGKTITVQYFEETVDKDGNISLRFPTCKTVYENERDI